MDVPSAKAYSGWLTAKSHMEEATPSVASPNSKFPPGARIAT